MIKTSKSNMGCDVHTLPKTLIAKKNIMLQTLYNLVPNQLQFCSFLVLDFLTHVLLSPYFKWSHEHQPC
jgi:hypothetical protein